MQFPPLLASSARVALVTPAGPLRGEKDVEQARRTVRAFGWEPIVGTHVLDHEGYLAGSDASRLADFNRVSADHSIDAVWCIRGGYGSMRMLDEIDYDAWRRRPKSLIGYSDITALHAAIGARAELVTFHGPTAREQMTPFRERSLRAALVDRSNPCGVAVAATTLCGGRARGRLAGGNLAIVAALCGTPYAIDLDGAILVVEDVNENVYRIDRLLTQLRLAGALRRVVGIAFGQFTDIPIESANVERPLERVLGEIAESVGVPCMAGIPMGHVDEIWTIPLGAMAELDADAKTLTPIMSS